MAQQAKYAASIAEETVNKVKGEMNIIRDSTVKKADLPNIVRDIVKEHEEERTRQVVALGFAVHVEASNIIADIEGKLKTLLGEDTSAK
eukprot:1194465-Pyramimonas_sp.AAC.1